VERHPSKALEIVLGWHQRKRLLVKKPRAQMLFELLGVELGHTSVVPGHLGDGTSKFADPYRDPCRTRARRCIVYKPHSLLKTEEDVVSTLSIALLNLVLGMAVVVAIAFLVRLAYGLPARSQLEADVESIAEPLPLSLIVHSERKREASRQAA
jgi:hypothetical protein